MIKNVKKFASRAWSLHVERQQRRADYWLLQNMSTKDLRDIGITPGEIRQRIYGPKSN
jgi:uncharacterized protein YjiS (DUF1127 family)